MNRMVTSSGAHNSWQPRASGGVPDGHIHSRHSGSATPREWGCTRRTASPLFLESGSPAQLGVAAIDADHTETNGGLQRVSGDEPSALIASSIASAGMNLSYWMLKSFEYRLPRVSGDEPESILWVRC